MPEIFAPTNTQIDQFTGGGLWRGRLHMIRATKSGVEGQEAWIKSVLTNTPTAHRVGSFRTDVEDATILFSSLPTNTAQMNTAWVTNLRQPCSDQSAAWVVLTEDKGVPTILKYFSVLHLIFDRHRGEDVVRFRKNRSADQGFYLRVSELLDGTAQMIWPEEDELWDDGPMSLCIWDAILSDTI